MKHIIPVFLPVLFVISCSSPPEIKPDWVINEPNSDDDYWVGIGIIKKPLPDDYREIAQQRALNEIGSQINVQLTSTVTSVIQELNYDVDEYFSSIIETRINQNGLNHFVSAIGGNCPLEAVHVKMIDTFSRVSIRYFISFGAK